MATLTSAYGRNYKTKKEALADFEADKDFVYNSFDGQTYCSKSDLKAQGIKSVNIRYKNNTEIAVVKI